MLYIQFLLQTLFQSVSNISSFCMVIPLCVEYLALAHCAFLPARHATTGISNPLYNLPSPKKKKKTEELKERQDHLSPMRKGLCCLQEYPKFILWGAIQVICLFRLWRAVLRRYYACISEDLNTQQLMSVYKIDIEGRVVLVFVHKQSSWSHYWFELFISLRKILFRDRGHN